MTTQLTLPAIEKSTWINTICDRLGRLGWEVRAIEIFDTRAKFEFHGNGRQVVLSLSPNGASLERSLWGADPRTDAIKPIFLGRDRYPTTCAGFKALAHYLSDNLPNETLRADITTAVANLYRATAAPLSSYSVSSAASDKVSM